MKNQEDLFEHFKNYVPGNPNHHVPYNLIETTRTTMTIEKEGVYNILWYGQLHNPTGGPSEWTEPTEPGGDWFKMYHIMNAYYYTEGVKDGKPIPIDLERKRMFEYDMAEFPNYMTEFEDRVEFRDEDGYLHSHRPIDINGDRSEMIAYQGSPARITYPGNIHEYFIHGFKSSGRTGEAHVELLPDGSAYSEWWHKSKLCKGITRAAPRQWAHEGSKSFKAFCKIFGMQCKLAAEIEKGLRPTNKEHGGVPFVNNNIVPKEYL